MFSTVVNLERYLYSRFDIVQDFVKEIVNRRAELSQQDILKVLEAISMMKQPGVIMLAN